jgi:WD40 repeat protein
VTYPTSGDTLINNVAWSPDGTTLAVSGSARVYLFNAKTAQLLRSFSPQSVAFHTNNGSPLIFTGAAPLSSTVSLGGGNSAFENVVWSADGKNVAAAYNFLNGSQHVVYIWDAATGAAVKTLTGFPSDIIDITWSPRGNMLATVGIAKQSTSPEVNVWNTTTWQVVKQYPTTTALAWSPDGNQLALVEGAQSYADGKDVRIVDTQTWQTVRQFAGPQGAAIQYIHWSPDGSRFMLETQDTPPDVTTRISLWSATSGTLLYSFPSKYSVYNAAWSPDGKHISSVQSVNSLDEYVTSILIWVA